MDSSTTQGTSSASMIILATVVFPEALPPPRPAGRSRWASRAVARQGRDSPVQPGRHSPGLTSDGGARGAGRKRRSPGPCGPHLTHWPAHQWRRPPWTVCHARCTRVAALRCRWCACWCAAGAAQTCTGWWCASAASARCPRVGGAGPGRQHCCCRGEGHARPAQGHGPCATWGHVATPRAHPCGHTSPTCLPSTGPVASVPARQFRGTGTHDGDTGECCPHQGHRRGRTWEGRPGLGRLWGGHRFSPRQGGGQRPPQPARCKPGPGKADAPASGITTLHRSWERTR